MRAQSGARAAPARMAPVDARRASGGGGVSPAQGRCRPGTGPRLEDMDMTSDKTSRSQRLLLTVAVVATLLLAGLGVRWLTAPDSSPLAHLPTPPPLLEAIGPIPMYGVQIVVALAGAVTGIVLLAPRPAVPVSRGARVSRDSRGGHGAPASRGSRGGRSARVSLAVMGVGTLQVIVFGLGFGSTATLSSVGYLLALAIPPVLVGLAVLLLRDRRGRPRILGVVLLAGLALVLVILRDVITDVGTAIAPLLREQADQFLTVGLLVAVGAAWAGVVVLTLRSSSGDHRHLVCRTEAWVLRNRRRLTIIAACGPLPYALIRLTWLTPWPLLGGSVAEADPSLRLWGLAISGGAWLGVILTLGLIRPWGEVFPRWFPVVGGRPVPVAAAVIPGLTAAALLTFAALPMMLSLAPFGLAVMISMTLILPCGVWGPALALAVWGYAAHRRSTTAPRPGPTVSARMEA